MFTGRRVFAVCLSHNDEARLINIIIVSTKGSARGIFVDILNKLRSKSSATAPILQNVDVEVDLPKLLDIDSSLAARKKLAEELNVHAGEHGSAEQNIALHKAVMRKLAENGGKAPDSLRD
jgi:hypothetical protein